MRLLAALRQDLAFQYRHGFLYAYGMVTLLLIVVLVNVPQQLKPMVATLLIFSELTSMGTFFVCGIVLLERGQGTLDHLAVTPLRLWEYLSARGLALTILGVIAATAVAMSAFGPEFSLPLLILGVGLTSLAFTILGLMASSRITSMSQLFTTGIPILIPVVLLLGMAPGVHYALREGAAAHPLMEVVPGTAALTLIGGAFRGVEPLRAALATLVLCAWTGAAFAVAHTWFCRHAIAGAPAGAEPPPVSIAPRRAGVSVGRRRRPTSTSRVISLLRVDMRSALRDPFLLLCLLIPLMLAAAIRFGVPALREQLVTMWAIDITPYYDLITAFQVLLVPLTVGGLVGFIVLDERDEGAMLQLAVSPLGHAGYLAYRVALPAVVGFTGGTAGLALSCLLPLPHLRLVMLMAAASLGAPLLTLILASFAPSKVEGLALNKVAGSILVVPVAAYFLPKSWEAVMLPLAPYWVMRAVQTAPGPILPFVTYTALAAAANFLWLALVFRVFTMRLHHR